MRAYYNAHKEFQTKKSTENAAKGATKREPTKAQKIAALKKQLKDLE